MFGEPRPVSPQEVDVIRAAFAQGQPLRDVSPATLDALPSLTVVARCPCGCASVDFAERAQGIPRPTLLADAVATNADGTRVGVMVWGAPDAITAVQRNLSARLMVF